MTVPIVEEELITFQYHPSSSLPPFFSGVHFAQYLVFCVVFYESLVVFCIIILFLICIFICYSVNIFSPLNYYKNRGHRYFYNQLLSEFDSHSRQCLLDTTLWPTVIMYKVCQWFTGGSSSIYRPWVPLWYLQALLISMEN